MVVTRNAVEEPLNTDNDIGAELPVVADLAAADELGIAANRIGDKLAESVGPRVPVTAPAPTLPPT